MITVTIKGPSKPCRCSARHRPPSLVLSSTASPRRDPRRTRLKEYVIVCVFIHWQGRRRQIYQYNHDATVMAIKHAMAGTPKIDEIISQGEKHPFSPK